MTPSLAGKACIVADTDAAVSYWIPALRLVTYLSKPLSEDLLAYAQLKQTGLISYNLTHTYIYNTHHHLLPQLTPWCACMHV